MPSLWLANIVALVDEKQISFVYDIPGAVKTHLGKVVKTVQMAVPTAVLNVIDPLSTIPLYEAGER